MRAEPSVQHVDRCELQIVPRPWQFAIDEAAAIDARWSEATTTNKAIFNGIIHMVADTAIVDGTFRAQLLRTDFKSYYHWRHSGFPEVGVRDGFGSALIRSSEGHVVLGRQREGNVNAGLAYLPGGFIDPRDVRADTIDIAASITREIREETGLQIEQFEAQPGYILTFAGPLISMARGFQSKLSAEQIREQILAHIAQDAHSELVDAVIVRSIDDLEGLAMPEYARILLTWLFNIE